MYCKWKIGMNIIVWWACLPHRNGPFPNHVEFFHLSEQKKNANDLFLFMFIFLSPFLLKNDMARKFLIRFAQGFNLLEVIVRKFSPFLSRLMEAKKKIFCRIISQFMT